MKHSQPTTSNYYRILQEHHCQHQQSSWPKTEEFCWEIRRCFSHKKVPFASLQHLKLHFGHAFFLLTLKVTNAPNRKLRNELPSSIFSMFYLCGLQYDLCPLWCHFQLPGNSSRLCSSISWATVCSNNLSVPHPLLADWQRAEPVEKERQPICYYCTNKCPRSRAAEPARFFSSFQPLCSKLLRHTSWKSLLCHHHHTIPPHKLSISKWKEVDKVKKVTS